MNKLIIAHRGASEEAHENTLAAFQEAMDLGSDMVEFDVRETRNGELVVIHDDRIGDKPVSDLSLNEAKSAAAQHGFELPTLEETLRLLEGKIRLDVELKEEGYEERAVNQILRHFDVPDFSVTTFHDSSIRALRRRYSKIHIGLLLGVARPRSFLRTRLSELFPEKRCRETGADILVPHYKLLKFGFLRRAQQLRKKVWVWTVDERALMASLLKHPAVDAIITNRPDVALAVRRELDNRQS